MLYTFLYSQVSERPIPTEKTKRHTAIKEKKHRIKNVPTPKLLIL